MSFLAAAVLATVTVYPATPGAVPSTTYAVRIDGQSIPVEHFKDVSYARCAVDGPADATVTIAGGVKDFVVSPRRSVGNAVERLGGDTLRLRTGPAKLIWQCAGKEKLFLFLDRPEANPPRLGDPQVVDVRDYVGPGPAVQRDAIQRALDDIARRPAGGVLYFPAGLYRTGTLVIRSHTTVYLESGALLQGTADPADYYVPGEPKGKRHGTGALLYFWEADGSRLIGPGTLAGMGTEIRRRVPDHPRLCNLVRSRNCEIGNVVLRDSGGFNIHALQCDNLWLHDYKIVNDLSLSNQDGTDPDSSRHVLVDGVFMYTSDDAIAVKGDAGLCEDVTVRDCVFWTKKSALKVGSDPYYGARRIRFENNDVVHADRALALYARRGFIDGAEFIDNAAEEVGGGSKRQTIVFLVSKGGPGGETSGRTRAPDTGWIRHVRVDGLTADCESPEPSVIAGDGAGRAVSDVLIRNYRINGRPVRDAAGGRIAVGPDATGVRFEFSAAPADVTRYGAKGDGRTLDTAAIQQAIDAQAAAGGGVVRFPAGRYLSGSLRLSSRITLELTPQAVLLGSRRMADYPNGHLLFADGAEDIAIGGGGAIDGQGDAYFDAEWKPAEQRPSPLLEFRNVKGLRIEGVTIRNAPAWTVHPLDCEQVVVRDVALLNQLRAVNTDGIDIDSSREVLIKDCRIEAGDDCIVLKTTGQGGGAVRPTEFVRVSGCRLVSAASALKLGTESRGDFRHIWFSDCIVGRARTGIALLAKDGGAMEDVRFSAIAMTTAPKWGQGLEWPIVIDVEKRTNDSPLSHIRGVTLEDIAVTGKGRVMVTGTPDSPIEDVRIRGLDFTVTGYEELRGAKKMRGGSQTVASGMPDYAAVPSALIFAYERGLAMDGVSVRWPGAPNPPARTEFYGDHLEAAHLEDFWRRRIRENFFISGAPPDLHPEVHRRFAVTPGVRAEAVTYGTEFGLRIPAILYLPDPLPEKRIPAFIVVNGHGGDKYSWYAYYTGVTFARGGMAVLTYDPAGEGERSSTRASGTREHDRLQGGEVMARQLCGLMLTDVSQGVSYLRTRPEIDPARIAAGGYSMGSFVMSIAGAIEPRLRAAVMVGGGNLDGPGGYWDRSSKLMCQALPYQSLQFLGDRPAVLYSLQAARGPALAWNGRADTVVNMPRTQEPFWDDLRSRVAKLRGSAAGILDYGFTPAGSHRPYWLSRGAVLWLNDKVGFPRWNRAQIEAMPLTHISEWSRRVDFPIERMYATEAREGGLMAIGGDVPGVAREQLSVLPADVWQREKEHFTFAAWTRHAKARAAAWEMLRDQGAHPAANDGRVGPEPSGPLAPAPH